MNTHSTIGVPDCQGVDTATLVLLGCNRVHQWFSFADAKGTLTDDPILDMTLITLPFMIASSFDV
jgi:hypothetical protein